MGYLTLACEVSRLVVLVVQLWTRLKYLICPSAKRLHLSSFCDFPHFEHLIDLPCSESLVSVLKNNSFNRSISDNLLGSWLLVSFWRFLERLGITVRVDSLDTPSFELLLLNEPDDWVHILDNSTLQDFSSFSIKMLTEPFSNWKIHCITLKRIGLYSLLKNMDNWSSVLRTNGAFLGCPGSI